MYLLRYLKQMKRLTLLPKVFDRLLQEITFVQLIHRYSTRITHTSAYASRNIIAGAQSTRPLGAEHPAHCSAAHA